MVDACEEARQHLESTRIDIQKKGERFIPIRNRTDDDTIGLSQFAPGLAKPVSSTYEMFEVASKEILVTSKIQLTKCRTNDDGDDDSEEIGCFATDFIEKGTKIFEKTWQEQRAPCGGLCMVSVERLKYEYNVRDSMIELLKERFYSDLECVAVPTSMQTFMKIAPEQYLRCCSDDEEANVKYDCLSDTYVVTKDIINGEELKVPKKDKYKSKPGSMAIKCDLETVENELVSWLEECPPLRLQASKIHDVGVFLASDYNKPIEMPVSQLSELLQGHFRMANCPHGWLDKEKLGLNETIKRMLRERFCFTYANQTFPLKGGFHRVTFAQFLNHAEDSDALVCRDRTKPIATYRFNNVKDGGKKGDEITIDYRIDSATEDARDFNANKVYYEWSIAKKSGPWEDIGKGASERKGTVDYSKWDKLASDSED